MNPVASDMEKGDEAEHCWAPLTPVKPILSKPSPICGHGQQTEEFRSGFVPGAQAGPTTIQVLADRGGTETGREIHNQGCYLSGEADAIWAIPGTATGTFTSLLALADAAVVPNGYFLGLSDPYLWRAPTGGGPWTGGNYTAPSTCKLEFFFFFFLELK